MTDTVKVTEDMSKDEAKGSTSGIGQYESILITYDKIAQTRINGKTDRALDIAFYKAVKAEIAKKISAYPDEMSLDDIKRMYRKFISPHDDGKLSHSTSSHNISHSTSSHNVGPSHFNKNVFKILDMLHLSLTYCHTMLSHGDLSSHKETQDKLRKLTAHRQLGDQLLKDLTGAVYKIVQIPVGFLDNYNSFEGLANALWELLAEVAGAEAALKMRQKFLIFMVEHLCKSEYRFVLKSHFCISEYKLFKSSEDIEQFIEFLAFQSAF